MKIQWKNKFNRTLLCLLLLPELNYVNKITSDAYQLAMTSCPRESDRIENKPQSWRGSNLRHRNTQKVKNTEYILMKYLPVSSSPPTLKLATLKPSLVIRSVAVSTPGDLWNAKIKVWLVVMYPKYFFLVLFNFIKKKVTARHNSQVDIHPELQVFWIILSL